MSSGCNYVKAATSPEWKPEFPRRCCGIVTLCVPPQRFPAQRQARRDGRREAGQTGDAERTPGDRRSEDTPGPVVAYLNVPKRQTAASNLLSGDERPEAHRRSGRSEGAAAGASERTGRADEHRALAGDRSHAGKPDRLLLPHLVRSRPTSDDVSPPRFSFRCCRRGSVNVEGAFLLNFKNSESQIVAGLLLVMQFEYSEEQDGGLGALDGSVRRATRRPPGG